MAAYKMHVNGAKNSICQYFILNIQYLHYFFLAVIILVSPSLLTLSLYLSPTLLSRSFPGLIMATPLCSQIPM